MLTEIVNLTKAKGIAEEKQWKLKIKAKYENQKQNKNTKEKWKPKHSRKANAKQENPGKLCVLCVCTMYIIEYNYKN